VNLQDWSTFAVVVGGASGALTGLIFVAVSLNRDRVVGNPMLSAIAFKTLVLFILPLGVSISIATPVQAGWAVGAELMAIGVVGMIVLVLTKRQEKRFSSSEDDDSRLASALEKGDPGLLTASFTFIAGLSEVIGHGGRLYWLVPAVFFALVAGIANAWLFLVGQPSALAINTAPPGESSHPGSSP
jgi:hypothetical protein